MQQRFQRSVLSGFRSTHGRWAWERERQDERTFGRCHLGQPSIFPAVAVDDQGQPELCRKLFCAQDELFIGRGDNDRYASLDHRLQRLQRIILFNRRQRSVGLHGSLGIAKPLSIKHRLASERDGAHWTTGKASATTTWHGKQNMLGNIAHQQGRVEFTAAGGQQGTAAPNYAISWCNQSGHKALLTQRRGVRQGHGLISGGKLRSDLTIPIAGCPVQTVTAEGQFSIGINETRVDGSASEVDFMSVSGNRNADPHSFDHALPHDDSRLFQSFLRMQDDFSPGEGEDGRRLTAKWLLRNGRFVRANNRHKAEDKHRKHRYRTQHGSRSRVTETGPQRLGHTRQQRT